MVMNKGILLVLMTALVSGFSIFLNSFAVKGFDSSVFTFSKNIFVAILLMMLIYALGQWQALTVLTKKQWISLVVIGLVGGSIPFLLFFKGLQMSTGATGSFIYRSLFLFASLMALLFLKERLNKWTIGGVAAIIAGTYLMIRPQFSFGIPELLILVASMFWAAENVLSKKALYELSGNIVAWGRMFFGSFFIMMFLFITGKASLLFSMTDKQYLWIIITSVLLCLYVLTYYNGLKHVSVATATAILSLGAPITAILSWAYGTGKIALYDLFGISLMLAGVTLIMFYSSKISVASHVRG
jgi:drug/metabolite transporter (DMT)-like permease